MTDTDFEARLAAIEARLGPAPQAVPPVTIGELTDVPAPGSPIASAWAVEVTRRSLHRFATVAARDAAYPAAGAGNGAVCVTTDSGTTWTVVAGVWIASPSRVIAYNVISAHQSGIGAGPVDMTGFTATFTALPGRTYRIDWLFQSAQVAVAAGQQTYRLYDNGALLSIVAQKNLIPLNGLVMWPGFFNLQGLAGGSHTVKLAASQDTASATTTITGATVPGRFWVTELL